MLGKPHLSCFVDEGFFKHQFILNVVDLMERKEPGSGYSKHLQLVECSVAEEVGSICHCQDVGGSRTCIEQFGIPVESCV